MIFFLKKKNHGLHISKLLPIVQGKAPPPCDKHTLQKDPALKTARVKYENILFSYLKSGSRAMTPPKMREQAAKDTSAGIPT
jgi:hypothetical protein